MFQLASDIVIRIFVFFATSRYELQRIYASRLALYIQTSKVEFQCREYMFKLGLVCAFEGVVPRQHGRMLLAQLRPAIPKGCANCRAPTARVGRCPQQPIAALPR